MTKSTHAKTRRTSAAQNPGDQSAGVQSDGVQSGLPTDPDVSPNIDDDPNEPVGYQKPPKAYRFKPGQSGNPKGRPKRARSMLTLIREELDKPVQVTEQGHRFELTKSEAIAMRLVNESANGNMRAMVSLIRILDEQDEQTTVIKIRPDDQAIFDRLKQRWFGSSSQSNEDDPDAAMLGDDDSE